LIYNPTQKSQDEEKEKTAGRACTQGLELLSQRGGYAILPRDAATLAETFGFLPKTGVYFYQKVGFLTK